MISSYEYVEYVDGTMVAACLLPVDSFWPTSFFVGSIVLFFIVPLLILVVLYSVIAKNLMDNPSIIMSNASSGVHRGNVYKYRKQVIFMLGAVVVSFFVCLLPFRALTLWIIIVPSETIVSVGIERFYIMLYFCRIMLYMNSAINPILYNLMSSKFRNGFLQLLGCGKIVRSDSISSGARKGGGTFHTGSTNLSSSHGTSGSSQRKSRDDSFGSSTRRPTVQFQQPPVSAAGHVAPSRRTGSIISVRAGADRPNHAPAPPDAPPMAEYSPLPEKIVEEQQQLKQEEEDVEEKKEERACISSNNNNNTMQQQQQQQQQQPHQQTLPPHSNGFHRIKDRIRFNSHHHHQQQQQQQSHRKKAPVPHRHKAPETTDASAVAGGKAFAQRFHHPQRHGNDNKRFTLLRAASTALATTTGPATPTAHAATVAVMIVASRRSSAEQDVAYDRRTTTSVRHHLVLQRSISAQPVATGNGHCSAADDGGTGMEPSARAASIERVPIDGSSMECDI